MSAIRMLLSSSSSSSTGPICGDAYGALVDEVSHGGGHDEEHGHNDAFNHLYFVMLFIASLWFAGKGALRLGMPALVGEIIFGIIMGPHLLNLAGDEGSNFLIVIGEIGLVMLVVEAGIDVDVGMLKLIGARGVAIAVMGSILPMSFGFCISYLFMNTSILTSIAIGACFAPTSMGIALNVLKKAKLLNTPTGQLIIAAAILDDVIALIILSELQAMADPTPGNILLPLIVSPVLILGIGYLAIKWIPIWIKLLMNKVSSEYRENVILALLFLATFAFVPMCHFLGSSHLLGAFLAGLCFCTDHTIHHVWHHQIKRVLQWMLRIFFAATIGFAIPIREFTSINVIVRGLIYCICGIGKIVTGFFAQPLTSKEFFIVGFSMSAWGEFAFILATASFAAGSIDQESFSAVLLAVLLSVIYSPYALSFTISYFNKKQQEKMDSNIKQYEDTNMHPVYFAINTKARGQWGHQDKLLHKIFHLGFEIVDFRSWHAPEFNTSHTEPLTKESFYVMDTTLALPPTKHLDSHEREELKLRVKKIRQELRNSLGERAVINIKRWLPGVTKDDDKLEPTDDYVAAMFGGGVDTSAHNIKHKKTAEYCRTKAFKQAHSIMSEFEQKNTLQDLARRSKASLHSIASMRSMSDFERKNTMERLGNIVSLTNLWANDVAIGSPSNNSSLSLSLSPQPGHNKNNNNNNNNNNNLPLSGGGYNGMTSAGGAGALPISNDIINLYSHFNDNLVNDNDDDNDEGNNSGGSGVKIMNNSGGSGKRDESYMSYIYGDDDSEHHKLPEYSDDIHNNNNNNTHAHFEPKLAELVENDDENDDAKYNNNNNEISDQEEYNTVVINDNDNDNDNHMNKQQSDSSKLTIKVYPPALQPVASASPIDENTPHQHYID